MRIGVVFPQTEIGQDPAVIRDYAQAVESMGYTHILAFDSVVGANPNRPGGWDSQYTYQHAFHEPFVLFAFCAGVTRRIELVTGIVILPQRQTALVAKQAAAVDVLTGGRLRLGVGIGWNHVEYEALNTEWKTRGARQAEQIEVMRKLWTEDQVTFRGRFHTLVDVTMLPVPVQRPIPIWFGGSSDAVVKRAARIGDGYMPIMTPEVAEPKIAMLYEHMKTFGRDPAKFGLEGWLRFDNVDPGAWLKAAQGWKRLGAKIVMLYPMYRMPNLDDQIETLRRFKDVAAALG